MQSRFIHFAVWIAAGLAGLLSCVEINEELGKEYIPTRHLYDVYTDTIFLKEIRMEIADSLSGYSSSRMTIGTVRDDLFGLTTRECAFPLIPVSPNMDFGDNPKCTQFHFSAVRDTLSWPDENQKNIIQNINVFKLDKEIGEKAGYISGKNELQIGERVAPIFSYYGQDSLSFDFNRSFGDEYIAAIQKMLDDPDKTGLDSVGNYVKSLPGIYITVDAPASYGGRINMFDIPIEVTEDYYISGNYAELKFRSDYGNRKDVDSSFLFFFGAQEMQIYQDRQSSYSTLIPTSQYVLNLAESEELQQGGTPDKIYVEGACGVKPVVSSREIHESLLEKFGEEGIDPEAVIIHKATKVPVGKDQEQHLEMTRRFARRFNTIYGVEYFPEPTSYNFGEESVKIPGLDGSGKMGKSEGNCIYLIDDEKTLRKKVMRAVTDEGPQTPNAPKSEPVENLFTIMKIVSSPDTLAYFEEKYNNCEIRYGDMKKQLAEDILKVTTPIRERIAEIKSNDAYLRKVIAQGAEKARESASKTIAEVKKIMGIHYF